MTRINLITIVHQVNMLQQTDSHTLTHSTHTYLISSHITSVLIVLTGQKRGTTLVVAITGGTIVDHTVIELLSVLVHGGCLLVLCGCRVVVGRPSEQRSLTHAIRLLDQTSGLFDLLGVHADGVGFVCVFGVFCFCFCVSVIFFVSSLLSLNILFCPSILR